MTKRKMTLKQFKQTLEDAGYGWMSFEDLLAKVENSAWNCAREFDAMKDCSYAAVLERKHASTIHSALEGVGYYD